MSGLACLLHTRHRGSTITITLLCPLFFLFHAGLGQDPDDCSSKLKQAEIIFDNGRFDDVVSLLGNCSKNSEISPEERVRVHDLLSKTHFVLGQVELATNAIRTILSLSPNWTPDPERVPPPYVRMAEQIMAQMRAETNALKAKEAQPAPEQKTMSRGDESDDFPQTWHYVVGGVALGVGAYFLIKNGVQDSIPIPRTLLPIPPSLP